MRNQPQTPKTISPDKPKTSKQHYNRTIQIKKYPASITIPSSSTQQTEYQFSPAASKNTHICIQYCKLHQLPCSRKLPTARQPAATQHSVDLSTVQQTSKTTYSHSTIQHPRSVEVLTPDITHTRIGCHNNQFNMDKLLKQCQWPKLFLL